MRAVLFVIYIFLFYTINRYECMKARNILIINICKKHSPLTYVEIDTYIN